MPNIIKGVHTSKSLLVIQNSGYLSIQIQSELFLPINSEWVTFFLNDEGYTQEIAEGNGSGKYIIINIETNIIKELYLNVYT